MSIGCFVDPSPALDALVSSRKAMASVHWPTAPYVSHPVHATLMAGRYADPDLWLPALTDRLATIAPFTVECRSLVVFNHDPATGGTTVTIGVEPSSALHALQLAVAEIVAPFRDVDAAEILARRITDPVAAASARAYGAPWVGTHWHPHFTIGSFALPAEAPELQPLLEPFDPLVVPVRTISIWAIAGDMHARRATVALGTGAER